MLTQAGYKKNADFLTFQGQLWFLCGLNVGRLRHTGSCHHHITSHHRSQPWNTHTNIHHHSY